MKPLERPNDLPAASLLIQAIDTDPLLGVATVLLNWTDSFPGSEPRVRRQPKDPDLWNNRFRPELKRAAQDLRAQGHTNVLVQGYMRLPTWFAAGVELGKTAGFQVTPFQSQQPWSSEGECSEFAIKHFTTDLGSGNDLAVGVVLSVDLSQDVVAYLDQQQKNVGKYVCICPENGASNQAIHNAAEARGWAYKVRDLIRCLVGSCGPDQIHLFLAAPHSAILLLGHLWDRMPTTQLYEDLGSNNGYSPSFVIPN